MTTAEQSNDLGKCVWLKPAWACFYPQIKVFVCAWMEKSGPKSADFGQHLRPDKPFFETRDPGLLCRRERRQVESYTHPLSHIIGNNHIILQTFPGSLEPGQAFTQRPARSETAGPSFSFLSRRRRLQSPSIKSTSWTVQSSCEATTSQMGFLFLPIPVMIFSTGTICSRPGNRIEEQMELFTLHYLHMRGVNLKRHSPSRTRKSPSNKHGLAIDPSTHLWKWLIGGFKMKTFWLIPICLRLNFASPGVRVSPRHHKPQDGVSQKMKFIPIAYRKDLRGHAGDLKEVWGAPSWPPTAEDLKCEVD